MTADQAAVPPFSLDALFAANLPAPAGRFSGQPRFNFVGGHNDPESIPSETLAEIAADLLRRNGESLALYNLGEGPQGHLPLRAFLAGKLARTRGMAITAEDVLITSGSLQGLDFVNRLLVEPGDTVIVEEHSYQTSIRMPRMRGARVLPVKLDAHGIVIEDLEKTLDGLKSDGVRAKYIYTIPTVQNPTGSILPLDRRQALAELSRRHDVPIFEDECYADLPFGADPLPPALQALAPDRVIHIGSFSKNLAPALRLGYIVAGWNVLSRMLALKRDGGTSALTQMVVADYFSRHFDAHQEKLVAKLRAKRDAMMEALEREFGTAVEFVRPEGGIFLWIRIPGVDTAKLVAPAAAAGLVFNPGDEWSVTPETGRSHMRLCFALPSIEEIREGIATLARVSFQETGIPARSANAANRPQV